MLHPVIDTQLSTVVVRGKVRVVVGDYKEIRDSDSGKSKGGIRAQQAIKSIEVERDYKDCEDPIEQMPLLPTSILDIRHREEERHHGHDKGSVDPLVLMEGAKWVCG